MTSTKYLNILMIMFAFIFSLIIFTFTNTFFHDIKISALILIFCFGLALVFLIIKDGRTFPNKIKLLLIIILAFIISILSILGKDYRYDQELAKSFFASNSDSHILANTGTLSHYV